MSLSSLMKPHMWQRFGIKNVIRNTLKQNVFCKLLTWENSIWLSFFHMWYLPISIIGAASRATALQHEIVQRTMTQFNDHNYEEQDGVFTRPTLDLYLVNKYWSFLTNGAAKEEIADLENARTQL